MNKGKSFLGIIPARGGSRRLPRKNVLNLGDKPLIAWTIEAALGCQFLDEVMVTTEDTEIAEVAKQYGANVPFIRPTVLAKDISTSIDTVKHAIDFYKYEWGKHFDFIVLLQPTSPLRNSQHISEAIELLISKNADAIISVCEVDHSPLWMNTLPADHSMTGFIRDEIKNTRSQDLPKNYRLNGAIYICRTDLLMKENTFFIADNVFAYIMNNNVSVDIDDLSGFLLAKTYIDYSST